MLFSLSVDAVVLWMLNLETVDCTEKAEVASATSSGRL